MAGLLAGIAPVTGILNAVTASIDGLVRIADEFGGLFPSIIDRRRATMLETLPDAIAGQRDGDRSHLGSNLIHDEALLLTMFALADSEGRPDYAVAADRYLKRFAMHCANTPTGILPWGEHAFWHLVEDRVGNSNEIRGSESPSTHDHLRQAPLWLLEKLYGFRPESLIRFGEGLDGHWTEGEPEEYIRHAYIEEDRPYPRSDRSCDFPRHGGFYIFDWAFLLAKTGRQDFADRIRKMLDYWWGWRHNDGLLLTESRSPKEAVNFHGVNAPGQTLSLGVSLLESAPLVMKEAPDLAATMEERAAIYVDGFFSAPHDYERHQYVLSCKRNNGEVVGASPIWGSVYGVWPASYIALTCLCGYGLTSDDRLMDYARSVGEGYLQESFPDDVAVPAMDAGLGLGLLADLYERTRDKAWLDGAEKMAHTLTDVYFEPDVALPRGAAGIDWYESQMGPSFLLHGLAKTVLLSRDGAPSALATDYTAR
ncbi:MAG: hypothetical protein CME26_06640 [Gemmatimonadetes bacterium]|nr:hypothetical protein [Gemmatimonadota bacterium]|tara:strand:- start:2143 stop:3585 length:1443 start_codon:yes stop_codon:yes gene_type:complete